MTLKIDRATALAVFGAILAGAGTVLPWLSAAAALVGSVTRSGLEMGADAMLILGAAVVAGLAALSRRQLGWLVTAGAGAAILVVGWVDLGDLQGRTSTGNVLVAVGPGIYICLVGGALTLVGAALGLGARGAPRPT